MFIMTFTPRPAPRILGWIALAVFGLSMAACQRQACPGQITQLPEAAPSETLFSEPAAASQGIDFVYLDDYSEQRSQ
jgi:hypothetical protein